MLTVMTWDEIGGDWQTFELDLPANCQDPHAINRAVGEQCEEEVDEENEEGWLIESHTTTGRSRVDAKAPAVMTIVTRSDRNHLGIILINYENQE